MERSNHEDFVSDGNLAVPDAKVLNRAQEILRPIVAIWGGEFRGQLYNVTSACIGQEDWQYE